MVGGGMSTPNTEPISSDSIESVVSIVEVAEIIAASMDMKTSDVVRMIMRSWQLMNQLQSGKRDSMLAAMQVMASKPS